MQKKNKTVFVGMSGGVDSSVAALLLKERGYRVVGVFLRCWGGGSGPDATVGASCAEQDAEDARRVAGHLGIPFYVWDFEKEYKKKVVEYMVDGYRRGETPNPDVECNREIKFGLFFSRAISLGADYVATGHYVRLQVAGGRLQKYSRLFVAKDKNKDQSYFLWTLTQSQLAHCLFPIGDYVKPEVRKLAKRAGLPTADKKDSQGICFLGKVSVADFLREYIPARKGEIVTVDGHPVGVHNGTQFYTIGQRHLGIGDRLKVIGDRKEGKEFKPFYVAAKDVKKNTLTVAEGDDHPALYRKEITLRDVHFITPQHSHFLKKVRMSGMKVFARVRYRQPLSRATLILANQKRIHADAYPRKSASSPRSFAVLVFEHEQKFVAPGQSAVFYDAKGQMLGGGIIV